MQLEEIILQHNIDLCNMIAIMTKCLLEHFLEDGNWGSWSEVTCQAGIQLRSRVCDDPIPQNGGNQCEGFNIDVVKKFTDEYQHILLFLIFNIISIFSNSFSCANYLAQVICIVVMRRSNCSAPGSEEKCV